MNALLGVLLFGLALLLVSVTGMVLATAGWIWRARQKRKARQWACYRPIDTSHAELYRANVEAFLASSRPATSVLPKAKTAKRRKRASH